MKATVDMLKCSGHARCQQAAPQLFELDESGYALNEEIDVLPAEAEAAQRGVEACPERAISLQ